jgi:hypothetical protein
MGVLRKMENLRHKQNVANNRRFPVISRADPVGSILMVRPRLPILAIFRLSYLHRESYHRYDSCLWVGV